MSGEGVRLYRSIGCVREDEVVEGVLRCCVGSDGHPVFTHGVHRAVYGLERGVEMQTGQTVHSVEEDVRDIAAFGDVNRWK